MAQGKSLCITLLALLVKETVKYSLQKAKKTKLDSLLFEK